MTFYGSICFFVFHDNRDLCVFVSAGVSSLFFQGHLGTLNSLIFLLLQPLWAPSASGLLLLICWDRHSSPVSRLDKDVLGTQSS